MLSAEAPDNTRVQCRIATAMCVTRRGTTLAAQLFALMCRQQLSPVVVNPT